MKVNKIIFWQYVRSICIILVVLIHSKNGIEYKDGTYSSNFDFWIIERSLINFPVAIFIFLSGYFTNIKFVVQESSWTYIFGRIKRLVIPFFVWSFIYSLIKIIISGEINVLKDFIRLSLGLSSGQLYYILVLIQLTLISPILIKTIKDLKYYKIIILITPVYLSFLYIYVFIFGEQFLFYQTLFPAWLVFYYFGLWVRINGYPRVLTSSIFVSILFLFMTIGFSIFESYTIIQKGLSFGFASSQIKFSSFILTFSIINLIFSINTLDYKNYRIMKYIGDHSYGIYYVHMIWIIVVGKLLSLFPILSNNLPIFQFLQVLLTIILSVISIKITILVIGRNLSNKLLGF